MKRWISFLLCLAMAGSVLPFAVAEDETADARLARVTEAVKTTLDLDTTAYTDFRGGVSEQELGTVWDLSWSGDGVNLNVEALENGTVVNLWYSDNQDDYSFSSNLPTFPKTNAAAVKNAAKTFLDRVLDKATETVELKDPEGRQLRSSSVRFYGTIKLNGLPSPLTYSVTVRGSDNTVTSFNRDVPSQSFLGNIPSPTPAVTKADAAAKLRDTEKLELIYVLPDTAEYEAEETGKVPTPVLRYVPKTEGSWAVDAQTGAVVDIARDNIIYGRNLSASAAETAEDEGAAKGLTAVEQAGVEKLAGVLSKEELDKRIRSETAYQLDGYTVQSANYRVIKEDNDGEKETVVCTLRYTAGESESPILYPTAVASSATAPRYDRTFTVDARTGAVRILYSAEGWNKDRTIALTLTEAQETAKRFLSRYAPTSPLTSTDAVELYDTTDKTGDGAASFAFTFARKVNGIFFPTDAVTIRVDCGTGAVSGVSYNWHEKLGAFPAPTGLVTPEKALETWMGTYDAVLAYRLLPRELDDSVEAEAKLIALGMTKFYSLFLSYGLERPEGTAFADYAGCPGIDAKTGQPVEPVVWTQEKLAYDDIEGSAAAEAIRTLAEYGIGYSGGQFRPSKALTQWDLVCLLASTQGYRLNPETAKDEEKDSAYETVYRMGTLKREERSDDAALNRGQTVKLLLNAAGYASVAKLPDIYRTNYTDAASIPAADIGYAALAQAFGLVQGTYGASNAATRADAATLLVRLMSRET